MPQSFPFVVADEQPHILWRLITGEIARIHRFGSVKSYTSIVRQTFNCRKFYKQRKKNSM